MKCISFEKLLLESDEKNSSEATAEMIHLHKRKKNTIQDVYVKIWNWKSKMIFIISFKKQKEGGRKFDN